MCKERTTCTVLMVLHAAVFPAYFLPEAGGGNGCGMPVLATYGIFWILGTGSTLVIHLLTGIIRHRNDH